MYKVLSKYFIFFPLGLLFFSMPAKAQSEKPSAPKDTLLVGIAGGEPFVFNEQEQGIAIDIWNEIAEEKAWNFIYIPFESVDDALTHLKKGELDLVVGPISITSRRLEHIGFSQPFYNSSISIVSSVKNKSFWQKIMPLFSLQLLIAILFLIVILAIVGTFIWLSERKESPEQFSNEPLKGIGSGMWLAIATMSSTGYGDKVPITLLGRIIAGAWMVISIVFVTSFVASVASTLTLSALGSTTISTIGELKGANVATIVDSPSELFLKQSRVKVVGVTNLQEAFAKLKSNNVDAVVYDRPHLLYFLTENNDDDLYISRAEYYKQGYGFAFPLKSPLILDVNKVLLELAEDQEIERIVNSYIQKDE